MQINNLSVFFPAFNEEENIEDTVENSIQILKDLGVRDFEVIVVNDGSTDRTQEIVEELQKKDKRIVLVNHEKNRGYGEALKSGFRTSRHPWVVFTDSDRQFDFKEIDKFLPKIGDADLVLGYRLNRADSFLRTIYTFGWKSLARILLNLTVKDYSCGFKLIKKEVFDAVQPLESEEKVTQIEMLVKAKRKGFRFTEVGVHHYPRRFGTPTGAKLKVVIRSIVDIFKLWWKLR